MVELVDLSILAPFMKHVDKEEGLATCSLSRAVIERLNNQAFWESAVEGEAVSARENIHLIEVNTGDDAGELSTAELIDQEFGARNGEWQRRLDAEMKKRGLLKDSSGYVDEDAANTALRPVRDANLFSVKIDNLPEGMGPSDLESLLLSLPIDKVNYYTRIAVPRDDAGNFRRVAYVKFERLRWALKFLEDHRQIKVQGMVLAGSLAS